MNKQESQNQVSIIINGVRYDAVEAQGNVWCKGCDLFELCHKHDCASSDLCYVIFGYHKVFKKSDKKFEV